MRARIRAVVLSSVIALPAMTACKDDPYPWNNDPDLDGGSDPPDAIGPDAMPPPGGSGNVWLVGTRSEGTTGRTSIQPFYPTFSPNVSRIGFENTAYEFRFSRADNQIYYRAPLVGIVRDVPSGTHEPTGDVHVPTPPCSTSPGGLFDFDGDGNVHYKCRAPMVSPIYRNGAMIHPAVQDIAGVLEDGRVLVTENGQFAVLSSTGTELSRHTAGPLGPNAEATAIVGNEAWVFYSGGEVFKFSGTDTWESVGDIDFSADFGDGTETFVVHPAGRVFMNTLDPDAEMKDDRIIVSYAFDGTDRQLHWTERTIDADNDALTRQFGNHKMFYQP